MSPQLRFSHADDLRLASALAAQSSPVAAGHYDEWFAEDGTLRAPWRRFFALLGLEGLDTLARRAQALADENSQHAIRAQTPLALLPLLLSSDTWRAIEAGVTQRASLLEALMADTYGAQALLQEGLLPPALVLGHPGYLRALHGYVPPGGRYLHRMAFDLVRGADGGWQVAASHLRAPTGLGALLANRRAIAAHFPDVVFAWRVRELGEGYRQLVDMLHRLSLTDLRLHVAPNVVMLAAGPGHDGYEDHARLARHLGLPLVTGDDLLVRGQHVYLKTLQGLDPVHGILCQLNDEECDPLMLASGSLVGVPGLVQAMRAGHVLVANALGTGFLESAALVPFLPALAQRLLGEDVLMSSPPVVWFGQCDIAETAAMADDDWSLVATHGEAVEAGVSRSRRGKAGEGLRWQDRVAEDPERYVLQRQPVCAQTRIWQDGSLTPQDVVLRVFVMANEDGGWRVMPGALGLAGGAQLDAWVMRDADDDVPAVLPDPWRPQALSPRHGTVTRRAGEHLFGLGRHLERIAHHSRLLRWALGSGDGMAVAGETLKSLHVLCLHHGLIRAGTPLTHMGDLQAQLVVGLARQDVEAGLRASVQALLRLSVPVASRLPAGHGRLLHAVHEAFERVAHTAARSSSGVGGLLAQFDDRLGALAGALSDAMIRDHGWRLLLAGRHVERLSGKAAALRAVFEHNAVLQAGGFSLLLALFDSAPAYHARHQRRYEMPVLLDLLVLDVSNPRSVACIVQTLREEMVHLPDNGSGAPAELGELLPDARAYGSLAQLCQRDPDGRYGAVPALATRLHRTANAVAQALSQRYFSQGLGKNPGSAAEQGQP